MLRLRQLTLLLGDLVGLYIGLYFAVMLRALSWPGAELFSLITPMSQLFLVSVIINFIVGLYDVDRAKNNWAFFRKIIVAALVWMGLGVLFFYINPRAAASPKTILLLTTLLGFGLISIWRFLYNRFLSTQGIWQTHVVFMGRSKEVDELVSWISVEPQCGYTVCNVCEGENAMSSLNNHKSVHLIVVAPEFAKNDAVAKELYNYLFQQVSIVSLADFYETLTGRIPPFTFSEGWFIANLKEQYKKVYDRVRVLIDYAAAIAVGLVFVVTFLFIALAIKLSSPGPIFFKQTRIGRLGKPFFMYKYRTMKVLATDGSAETQGPQFAAHKDDRVTKIGKLLRKTRMDEMPQFINILGGEMAIIGPRPERPEFVTELTQKMPYYSLRHLIKPGITGWAQVHKAYYGTIEENLRKLEYDLYYIKNRGLLLDVSIMLRTVNILARMIGR